MNVIYGYNEESIMKNNSIYEDQATHTDNEIMKILNATIYGQNEDTDMNNEDTCVYPYNNDNHFVCYPISYEKVIGRLRSKNLLVLGNYEVAIIGYTQHSMNKMLATSV